ncbi:MAG TPA: DUF167 domain-containing protein [Stellaceae bacterium]|nr:DUF167 domain-containing protein [Stellaceae bacterium]
MPDGPWILARDGLRVAVRLTPRAKADRLVAVAAAADGKRMIKASVIAPPEDGRANEALLRLLARAWKLPRHDLAIVAGAASRHKTVRVAGDPLQLLSRLSALLSALPGH